MSQCYIKYDSYEVWKKEWFEKVLTMSYEKLNDNGYMIIFASDYGKYGIGCDCRDIMRNLSNSDPLCLKFGLPSLEYLRHKKLKKYDTAWVIKK